MNHEAPLDLLRRTPRLASALLAGTDVDVPPDAKVTIADSVLNVADPKEFRSDKVAVLEGGGRKLALIVEPQSDPPKEPKRRAMPVYVALAQHMHQCDAILVVTTDDPRTARACAKPIPTGHPGFVLHPIVFGPHTKPRHDDPANADVATEMLVFEALTGAIDLDDPGVQLMVVDRLAAISDEVRPTYTRYVITAASTAAQPALEQLMTTHYDKEVFLDHWEARGEARGEAKLLLILLEQRGIAVTEEARGRIESCADTGQLEAWFTRALHAATLNEVLGCVDNSR